MLTKRDHDIFELMSKFGGKTFVPVLGKTFFASDQQARNRLNRLKKDKLIRYVTTGLMSPRNAIYMTEKGKRYIGEIGLNTVTTEISTVTINHFMLEQIAYYYLKQIGKKVERTAVIKWREKHHHTPDLMYFHENDKMIYVEIERTHKRADKLVQIQLNMEKDNIHKVLYIFENEKKMEQIGKKIPVYNKALYVTVDTLIQSSQNGKIGAISQTEFYSKLDKKRKNNEK